MRYWLSAMSLSLVFTASVAFSVRASAQVEPPSMKSAPLSAAMAEVRRSPFWSTPKQGQALFAVSESRLGLTPPPIRPSFHRVFWPTLGAVFLSEFAFLAVTIGSCDNSPCSTGDLVFYNVMAWTALVAGPPAVARLMGAEFAPGLLGSAAGIGVGYALFRLGVAFGWDDSTAYWFLPITHSLLTTIVGRL